MYVKDLEVKSRYLEAECRRLGRLLHCCYAENQMLRISLQSGSTFAMAKPESAVLLLGMMIITCLLIIHLSFTILFVFSIHEIISLSDWASRWQYLIRVWVFKGPYKITLFRIHLGF